MRSAVVGVAVFAISLARSLAGGFGLTDEGWFLQIVNRLRSGDVLYRDVYVGVMPLSVYVTTALSWLTGVEILAVKIVTNAAFALTVVVADRLVRRAGATSAWAWALVGALLIGDEQDVPEAFVREHERQFEVAAVVLDPFP